MITSLSAQDLAAYVTRQLDTMFPDGAPTAAEVVRHIAMALERCAHCFAQQERPGFTEAGETRFDHLHTDQYAVFLYYLANAIYRGNGDTRVATKLYSLSKALHGLDLYYEIEMPEVFAVQHPLGTVLGRGTYGNFLFVYQNCLVGQGVGGDAPVLGQGTVLFGGSSVIGDCTLGDNVWVSAGTLILDANVPSGSSVFGRSPTLTIKPTVRDVRRDAFGCGQGAAR